MYPNAAPYSQFALSSPALAFVKSPLPLLNGMISFYGTTGSPKMELLAVHLILTCLLGESLTWK